MMSRAPPHQWAPRHAGVHVLPPTRVEADSLEEGPF